MNHSFNKAASVYILTVNENLAGFCAVLPLPNGNLRNAYRESRIVIFPDYQGIGLGSFFSESVAQMYLDNGKFFYSTTSNPALIRSRKNSKKWIVKRIGRNLADPTSKKNKKSSQNRMTVSFKYIG